MKYWVIKGNPNRYDWDEDLEPGYIENWGARALPPELAADDRLFLWESGGRSRIIGFGQVVRVNPGRDDDGRRPFDVLYLTSRLQTMLGIEELRSIPVLTSAQFLRAGPFATVYPLSNEQARTLYRAVAARNRHDHIWRDVSSAKALAPLPEFEIEALEGNRKLVAHLRRERDQLLAKKKKEQFRQTHGRLFCEACGSDHAGYGTLTEHAFEVHHLQPLGRRDKAAKTTLADLGVLCASCHRVIHRTAPCRCLRSLLSSGGSIVSDHDRQDSLRPCKVHP